MDAIPQAVMEELANNDQERCAEASAAFICKAIKSQSDFVVTPEWVAAIAAALSDKAKALSSEPREIAQAYLDDLHDDMKGCT